MITNITGMGGNSSKKSNKSHNRLSTTKIAQYKEIFRKFDRNSDGRISQEELGAVMRQLGQNPTEAELEQMIKEVDLDENGTIEFEEFVILMMHHMKQPSDDEEEIRQMFRVMDIDGNGTISPEELHQIMSNLGEDISEDEINAMIREADTDGDGEIGFEEFKLMFKKLTS